MSTRNLTLSFIEKCIIKRTNQIEVGREYFLSSFYDREGVWVKVLAKSTKENKCGWPSTVKIESTGRIVCDTKCELPHMRRMYKRGSIHTCNATNLYDKREDARHDART